MSKPAAGKGQGAEKHKIKQSCRNDGSPKYDREFQHSVRKSVPILGIFPPMLAFPPLQKQSNWSMMEKAIAILMISENRCIAWRAKINQDLLTLWADSITALRCTTCSISDLRKKSTILYVYLSLSNWQLNIDPSFFFHFQMNDSMLPHKLAVVLPLFLMCFMWVPIPGK